MFMDQAIPPPERPHQENSGFDEFSKRCHMFAYKIWKGEEFDLNWRMQKMWENGKIKDEEYPPFI